MEENKSIASVEFPEALTVAPSPHIRHGENTRGIMLDVIIALMPALIYGIFVFGYRALILTLVSVASCVFFEWGFQWVTKRPITVTDLSAAVTGVLLALNMPSTLPIGLIVVGAFFAIVVVKQIFGGIGKNIVNPALAARVFMFLSWPSQMAGYPALDGVASATPLSSLKTGDLSEIDFGDIIRMFLGIEKSGVIGEISAMLLVAGGIYLLVRRVITWHIPVSYLATVAVITLIFPRNGADNFTFMLAELCAGGVVLAAFFMATDYATSPVTKLGRIIFGIICGLITVFIRYFGAYNEGASFAILIANLLVYYIDKFTRPRVFGANRKRKEAER